MTNPDPATVPVVILCGGQGTRIREASEKLPKPLINIGNQPILWHIMKLYGHHGFRRFVLCLGYKAWDIKQYFLRFEEMSSDLKVHVGKATETEYLGRTTLDDWEVLLIDTGLETGTGGRLAAVAPHLDSDYFMVTYGDGLGDVDIGRQLKTLAGSDHLGMVTGVHPTLALRRAWCRGRPGHQLRREATVRWLGVRWLLRLQARVSRLRAERRARALLRATAGPGDHPRRQARAVRAHRLLDGHGHLPGVHGPQRHVGRRHRTLEALVANRPPSRSGRLGLASDIA